jgi:8-oxo-dGTP diphosphatase
VVYVGEASGEPCAADDARAVRICTLDDLPGRLAFDHAQILEDYRIFRRDGRAPPLER